MSNQITEQPKYEAPSITIDAKLMRMIAIGSSALKFIEAHEITNEEEAREVSLRMNEFVKAGEALDADRLALTKSWRDTIEKLNSFVKPGVIGYEIAADAAKKMIVAWNAKVREAEDRKRREAEAIARKLREEAEARAAAERSRAAEEARREREEADRLRLAAAAEVNAEKAAKMVAEAAQRDIEARQAVDNAILKSQNMVMVAEASRPIIAPTQAVSGVSERDNWVAAPDGAPDWMARLVAFVAKNPAFINLLEFNQPAANKLASSLKSAAHVDGLVFRNEPIAVRTRTRR